MKWVIVPEDERIKKICEILCPKEPWMVFNEVSTFVNNLENKSSQCEKPCELCAARHKSNHIKVKKQ